MVFNETTASSSSNQSHCGHFCPICYDEDTFLHPSPLQTLQYFFRPQLRQRRTLTVRPCCRQTVCGECICRHVSSVLMLGCNKSNNGVFSAASAPAKKLTCPLGCGAALQDYEIRHAIRLLHYRVWTHGLMPWVLGYSFSRKDNSSLKSSCWRKRFARQSWLLCASLSFYILQYLIRLHGSFVVVWNHYLRHFRVSILKIMCRNKQSPPLTTNVVPLGSFRRRPSLARRQSSTRLVMARRNLFAHLRSQSSRSRSNLLHAKSTSCLHFAPSSWKDGTACLSAVTKSSRIFCAHEHTPNSTWAHASHAAVQWYYLKLLQSNFTTTSAERLDLDIYEQWSVRFAVAQQVAQDDRNKALDKDEEVMFCPVRQCSHFWLVSRRHRTAKMQHERGDHVRASGDDGCTSSPSTILRRESWRRLSMANQRGTSSVSSSLGSGKSSKNLKRSLSLKLSSVLYRPPKPEEVAVRSPLSSISAEAGEEKMPQFQHPLRTKSSTTTWHNHLHDRSHRPHNSAGSTQAAPDGRLAVCSACSAAFCGLCRRPWSYVQSHSARKTGEDANIQSKILCHEGRSCTVYAYKWAKHHPQPQSDQDYYAHQHQHN